MIVVTQLVLLPLLVSGDLQKTSQPVTGMSEIEDASTVTLLQTTFQASRLAAKDSHKLALNSSSEILKISDKHCFLKGPPEVDVLVGKSEHMATLELGKASGLCDWNPTSVEDLSRKYDEIFADADRNRNAASHLWASFILDRAHCLSHEQIVHMFSGFCAVSGSPLGEPGESQAFVQNLEMVGGGTKSGYTYHCCWPCFCDEQDAIKVDTKTVRDKNDVEKAYFFEVIGDPCTNNPTVCTHEADTGCIPQSAPGVQCREGKLKGATFSKNEHPIIGMYFTDMSSLGHSLDGNTPALQTEDGGLVSLSQACQQREASGMHSGMGTIFHNVAQLNPI